MPNGVEARLRRLEALASRLVSENVTLGLKIGALEDENAALRLDVAGLRSPCRRPCEPCGEAEGGGPPSEETNRSRRLSPLYADSGWDSPGSSTPPSRLRRARTADDAGRICAASSGSPALRSVFRQAGLLGHVMSFAGQSEYLFFAGVSKVWKAAYLAADASAAPSSSAAAAPTAGCCGTADRRRSSRKKTSLLAVVVSVARLEWAMDCGGGSGDGGGGGGLVWSAALVKAAALCPDGIGALQWAFDTGHLHPDSEVTDVCGRRLCELAAGAGRLRTLQWARFRGFCWSEVVCADAADGGHLDVLRWARANGCQWDEFTCRNAAASGHLSVLRWARENGCPWSAVTCALAAGWGQLDVLSWSRANGCPWDESACAGARQWAAHSGDGRVLEWVHANGCPCLCRHRQQQQQQQLPPPQQQLRA